MELLVLKRILHVICFCFLFAEAVAMKNDTIPALVNKVGVQYIGLDWLEQMHEMGVLSDDGEEELQMEYLESEWQELEEWKDNPLNLNTASRAQLERFPFLSDFQIEKLQQHIYVHGSMESIYELQLVEGMDREAIQYLLPYVCVLSSGTPSRKLSFKNAWKYGKQEIVTRFDVPLYTREGYRKKDEETLAANPNKQYLGPSWYHSLRYSFHYSDRFYVGFTAEKDAGEPFFAGHNRKGYDSYSFYLLLREVGRIKALAVGKYRVTFGQGLVVGSDNLYGKGTSISALNSRNSGFRKHSSTDEYNYFRGMGGTYMLRKQISLSLFYSHRSLDGIADEKVLTSINTTGKHTLPREVERKNVATLQTVGANLTCTWPGLQLGLTAVSYYLDKYYDPQYREYNKYYFRGKKGYNIGVSYKYRFQNALCNGELAVDRNGNTAMLHALHYFPSTEWRFILLYRYYDMKYQAFHSRSISEGGRVQNENGIYLGVETHPLKYWKLTAYADFFRFPYLRYLVDEPSSGFDGLAQCTYTPFSSLAIDGYYRYRRKGKNYTDTGTKKKSVLPYIVQRAKLQGSYSLHPNCVLRTLFQYVWEGTEGHSTGRGSLFAQSVTYTMKRIPLQLNVLYAFFDTDAYASRVYSYERGLLYSFYTPSFYGKGTRMSASLRYDFSERLMCILKYGETDYSDRDCIGSGMDEIRGSQKADLCFQLRWKF